MKPAPLFHAVTKEIRKTLWLAYSMFVAAFREAAERLKAGELSLVRFPVGSFPPGPISRNACHFPQPRTRGVPAYSLSIQRNDIFQAFPFLVFLK